ncbi:unnamed protein product [Schistosoma margrebowiei]|uniref:Uncharacterized protein n=1 Tax=Schistosoma margrebowiei TaxID=48269 RepID=A0A183M923_9TREM|nr:unnamed protein product [Schistosoma margrebowiei]
MVVGGSRQETLDPGFVLLGTRQQGIPVILKERVLPGRFDLVSTTSNHHLIIMMIFFHNMLNVLGNDTIKQL